MSETTNQEEAWVVITSFIDPAPARDLAEWLETKGVSAVLTDTTPRFDVGFANQTAVYEYQVRVPSMQLEQAQSLMEEAGKEIEIAEDHYLLGFTDEELFDILRKKDEWSDVDYHFAQRLLKQRGHSVDESTLETLRSERLAEMVQPPKRQHILVLLGYMFVLLGGIPAIFIGLSLSKMKKKLPDGRKIWLYQEADRRHGVIIYRLGILVFPIAILARIIAAFV